MAGFNVYGADVLICAMPSGRFYFRILSTTGTPPDAFVGPWRDGGDEALRDAASWLEEHGYVHPMTHEIEGVNR